jgi:hypothetical protein
MRCCSSIVSDRLRLSRIDNLRRASGCESFCERELRIRQAARIWRGRPVLTMLSFLTWLDATPPSSGVINAPHCA